MPYRRLPNTDNARIKALRTAVERNKSLFGQERILLDIKNLEHILRTFETARELYKVSLDVQASANRKLQKLAKNARLYTSHFIQVLNFCVIRNEIKKELKELYGLDPDNFTVPDLISNEMLYKWGANIIKGEQTRINQGGTPIYNPTIARVNVAFSLFSDAYIAQKTYQNNTARQLEALSMQRDDIDKTLCALWNQIEAHFAEKPQNERLLRCKEYGIVYYLRKGEKERAKKEELERSENN
ncbi:MAG: hypothetical protein QM660_06715 [Dysgonomonas sp.]